jgi:hypothetical protein
MIEPSKKELVMKLKQLRSEHSGKPISKMTPEELTTEIEHHETACKARLMKAKRLEALTKARETKKVRKTDDETNKETVGSRKNMTNDKSYKGVDNGNK